MESQKSLWHFVNPIILKVTDIKYRLNIIYCNLQNMIRNTDGGLNFTVTITDLVRTKQQQKQQKFY